MDVTGELTCKEVQGRGMYNYIVAEVEIAYQEVLGREIYI